MTRNVLQGNDLVYHWCMGMHFEIYYLFILFYELYPMMLWFMIEDVISINVFSLRKESQIS